MHILKHNFFLALSNISIKSWKLQHFIKKILLEDYFFPLCCLAEFMNSFRNPKAASLNEIADSSGYFSKLFTG